MPMPEAAMNEDHGAETREDEVRRAWEIADMEPEPVAEPVHDRPDLKFRRSVLPADAGHHLGSLGCGEDVHEKSHRMPSEIIRQVG